MIISPKLKTSLRHNRLPLAILFLTWLTFFSRTIFLKQFYFLDDLKIIFYPLEHIYAQFQSAWALPEWSPLFGFGQPLLAWGQLGFFTPLHVILRFFGLHPLVLLQVSIVSYFALGLAGMFLFLRRQRLHPLAACLGAIVFVFCGFNVGHLNHVNFYVATMVLPWLLIAIHAFIKQPTLLRASVMAVVAAVVPLSGHAQISLYVLIVAGIYGIFSVIAKTYTYSKKHRLYPPSGLLSRAGMVRGRRPRERGTIPLSQPRWGWRGKRGGMQVMLFKLLVLTILAGVLALMLASFSILPLLEFLPHSDRAANLSHEELYEFSYPPEHAITLIFPYFFGDHEKYWGAKNFQELAAYVGIIPLLLAGLSLIHRQSHQALKTYSLILILLSLALGFGIHSPFYKFLVQQNIITSLAIPGRFVLFFDLGIAILATLGLNTIITSHQRPRHVSQFILNIAAGLIFTTAIFLPFISLANNEYSHWQKIAEFPLETILLISGIIAWLFSLASYKQRLLQQLTTLALVALAAISLLIYGWQYTPLTSAPSLQEKNPLHKQLLSYNQQHLVPARILSRPSLLVKKHAPVTETTQEISDSFSVYQPITIQQATLKCLLIPVYSRHQPGTALTISLYKSLASPPIRSVTLDASSINNEVHQQLCWPELLGRQGENYILSFTANSPSFINLYYEPGPIPADEQAYFVRRAKPTLDHIKQAQADKRIIIDRQYQTTDDPETILLARHTQVTTGSSAASWIGAFGPGQFREFVKNSFANDTEIINSSGQHTIKHNRPSLNMSGITHLIQAIPHNANDIAPAAGFVPQTSMDTGSAIATLYRNPEAFDKAFLVAELPISPNEVLPQIEAAEVTIKQYKASQVDINVRTPQDGYLILTDTWTPQWQTTVDGRPAQTLIANTIFRAAKIPAGEHTVVFAYNSPAVKKAKILTFLAGIIVIIILFNPMQKKPNVTPNPNNKIPRSNQ